MARKMNLGSKTGKADFAAKAATKREKMAEKLEPEKKAAKPASPTKLTVNIDDAAKRDFKMWCIENGTTMSEFVLAAIEHRDQVTAAIKG